MPRPASPVPYAGCDLVGLLDRLDREVAAVRRQLSNGGADRATLDRRLVLAQTIAEVIRIRLAGAP